MSNDTTPTKNYTYTYTIGGDAGRWGGPHEPGDEVSPKVPESKVKEWLKAGVVRKRKERS